MNVEQPVESLAGEPTPVPQIQQDLTRAAEIGSQWVLQVTFPSACSFIVLVFTVSLHVSAYMAIFKCVGYFQAYENKIKYHTHLKMAM
jgi:hypothetical protein